MSRRNNIPAGQTRFNIDVTADRIARGLRANSSSCVVSQAIAASVPDATRIDTDIQTIRFTRNGVRYCYLTPYVVQGYVVAFDAGDPIEPFKFQLRDPIRIQRRTITDSGRAAVAAYNRVLRDTAIPAEDRKTKAKEAYRKAKGDEPKITSDGHRIAPPKVFKSKNRSYGHRLLRINQER